MESEPLKASSFCRIDQPMPLDSQQALDEQIDRLNTLYMVKHEAEDRPTNFHMEPYHIESLERLYKGYKRQIAIKGRQVYFTTYSIVLMFDLCIHREGFGCTIHNMTKDDMKRTIKEKVHYIAEHSPWAKKSVDTMTNEGVAFKNGSYITVTRSGRSHTSNFNLITEAAYTAEIFPDKFDEVHTGIVNGSQYYISFMETSPYGSDNQFISMVKRMEERRSKQILRSIDFAVLFIPWWKKPKNISSHSDMMMTEISDKMHQYFDEVERSEGTRISPEQRAFYMQKLEVESRGSMRIQREEHPSTLNEALSHNSEVFVMRRHMETAKEDGRVAEMPIRTEFPSFVTWDFGSGKSHTAFQVWQAIPGDEPAFVMVYSYQRRKEGLAHFFHILSGLSYNIRMHFLPHDALAHNFVASKLTGKAETTIADGFKAAGIYSISVLGRVKRKKAGFESSMRFIGHCRFCSIRANESIEALMNVQRHFDDKKDELYDELRPSGPASVSNHLYDCFELAARAHESNMLDSLDYIESRPSTVRKIAGMEEVPKHFDGCML